MKKNVKSGHKDQSIKAMLSLFRVNWLKMSLIIFFMALANFLIALVPYFLGKLADLGTLPNPSSDRLASLLFAMLALNIGYAVFFRIAGIMALYWQTSYIYDLRSIFQKFTWDYEYKDFIEKPSGKIASTIEALSNGSYAISHDFIQEDIALVVKFPVLIGVLFAVSFENSLLFSFFLLLLLVVSKFSLRSVRATAKVYANIKSSVNGRTFDSFSNYVNVKSFNSEKLEVKSLRNDNQRMFRAATKRSIEDIKYWTYAVLIIRLGLWASFTVLNVWLYSEGRLTIAGVITSVAVLYQFTDGVWGIVSRVKSVSTSFSEYRQNYNYLFPGRNVVKEYYDDLKKTKQKIFKPEFSNEVKLNKLNFAYPDRKDSLVLRNINLSIKKNEKIGIVGKSGSGKSTLIKLLLGFYDYKEGTIQIDGKNVTKEELGLINSYVPQDTTLFQQSVAYNIAYAKEGKASLKEVISAAKKAHAHEFINSLPDKYETLVGERGIKLSLGQRQRIAIARAFLKESDLLILDEATSALDSKTEKLVQESLEDLWKGKTVIAIAHRLSTLNNVDRIIVMDEGKIVEEGTKMELLSKDGIFAELWKHQKDGLIIEDEVI